ncbi:unnamed protein product [Gordionus sp. m RMFG-2023]|uniref:protein MAK16 homolog n=1 Tax=Gordionus sp. m RMFG-2023 TaxID=3053472 RepID=UPI0030E380EF
MQEDRITWNSLNFGFCGYKFQSKTQVFCRNEFNVTGLCSEKSCPLANSRYSTVKEDNGICYLYVKTIERSHFPNKLWEKIKLSRNMEKAHEQIKSELIYWPKFNVIKCQKRLLKINEYLNRTRKLRLTSNKELIPIRRKIDRREKRKEFKALKAANIETNIEKELIQRLKNGTYNDLYSFPLSAYDKALSDPKRELMVVESDDEPIREYVADSEVDSDFELSDIEDLEQLNDIGDWRTDVIKQKQLHTDPPQKKMHMNDPLGSSDENSENAYGNDKNSERRKKKIIKIHIEKEATTINSKSRSRMISRNI